MQESLTLEKDKIEELGFLLLDIGTLLMSSGANTQRIRLTINRISENFGYVSELLITHQALMLTMSQNHKQVYSCLKRCSPQSINFRILSGISIMSWALSEQPWNLEQIKIEVNRLREVPRYTDLLTLIFVSLSGASFCRLFGGNALSMIVTFFATMIGFSLRQMLIRRKYNFYLSIFMTSFVTSLFSGLFYKFDPSTTMEHAFASSILFLVPGIPLINSFSDLIDGNLLNGFLRGLNVMLIAFSMGLGWFITVILLGL